MNERDHGQSVPDNGDDERDLLGPIIRAAGRRPAPRDEDYRDVLAASRTAWQNKVRSVRRRRVGYAMAASLLIAGIVVVGVQSLSPPEAIALAATHQGRAQIMPPDADEWRDLAASDTALYPGTRIRTLADGRASFALSRGASLRLDYDTAVQLDSAVHIALRSGTLYLDSGAGVQTTPYAIETMHGTVRDIGTQFEVASYDDRLRIRIREGRVEIDPDDGSARIPGSQGQQLTLNDAGLVERGSISAYDPAWAWTELLAPAQQINGRSSFDVLTWVARETGRELRFEDATAERRARAAVLSGGDQALSPSEALDVATDLAELSWRSEDGVIWIRRR